MATDEDALICDFAETYHIYDYQGLSAEYAATLASGLRAGSRIWESLAGVSLTREESLLAQLVDNTRVLIWTKTKDAEKGRNYPKSILEQMMKKKEATGGYQSANEFEAARKRILAGV